MAAIERFEIQAEVEVFVTDAQIRNAMRAKGAHINVRKLAAERMKRTFDTLTRSVNGVKIVAFVIDPPTDFRTKDE